MPMTFEVTDEMYAQALVWKSKHTCAKSKKNHELNKRVASPVSNFSYSFTSTSIGTLCNVVCSCGASKDITDFSDW